MLDRADAAAEGIDDPLLRGELVYARCIQQTHATEWARVEDTIAEAIAHYERAEHGRMICSLRGERAFARLQLGDLEGARDDVERCVEGARRMGLDHVAFWALGLRSAVRWELDDVSGAVQDAQESAEAFSRQGDVRLEGAARVYLALASSTDGRHEEALATALRAIELLAPFPPLAGWAWAAAARCHLDAGDAPRALEASERGIALHDELGYLEEGDTLLFASHAEALEANGRDAREAWQRARALLRQRAAPLDEGRRRRLESASRVHRRIVERAGR